MCLVEAAFVSVANKVLTVLILCKIFLSGACLKSGSAHFVCSALLYAEPCHYLPAIGIKKLIFHKVKDDQLSM